MQYPNKNKRLFYAPNLRKLQRATIKIGIGWQKIINRKDR